MSQKGGSSAEKKITWWQLSLVGVGCIIGTGFFLASGLAIRLTGPSVLIAFIVAAIGTYIVGEALGKMAVKDPQKGSFRAYSKKAFGRWAGFGCGWVYWCSEILIIGSQLTALSIFSRFWFPNIPLWIFATIYAVLGIIVVLLGASGFEKAEDLFAIIKISAILMFIILAIAGIVGWIKGGGTYYVPNRTNEFFSNGILGLWSALIFGFYAFGGIEIMGMMTPRLRKKEDAIKANTVMLMILTLIYLLAVGLAVVLAPINQFTPDESPFVVAMNRYHLGFFPHVFNGAIIIAGFSTMTASLFAVTNILVTLSEDGDAPGIFSKKGKKLKVPPFALLLTIGGLTASIVTGRLMPDRVYEYITTAASLMLLYNWVFVLFAYPRLIKLTAFGRIKQWTGLLLILLAVSGTLFEKSSRPGFFISLGFIGIIAIVLLIMQHVWKKNKYKWLKFASE